MPDEPSDKPTRSAAGRTLREHQLVTVDGGKLTIFGRTPLIFFRRVCGLAFAVVTIFGGWGAASDDVPEVAAGKPIDVDQFTITVHRAVATIPTPSDDAFDVIEVNVIADTELTDDKGTSTASSVLSIANVDTQTSIATSVLDNRDSSTLTINPEQTIRARYIWSLPKSASRDDLPDSVTIEVNQMNWMDSMPISGYSGWLAGDPAATVTIPLEIKQ